MVANSPLGAWPAPGYGDGRLLERRDDEVKNKHAMGFVLGCCAAALVLMHLVSASAEDAIPHFGYRKGPRLVLQLGYSDSEASTAATILVAGKNGRRTKDQMARSLPQAMSFRPSRSDEYSVVFEVPRAGGTRVSVYGKLRVLATSPYTSSSTVKLTLDEVTVGKVLDGEVQIITITDPNVMVARGKAKPQELTLLTLMLGNRTTELR